MRKLLQLPDLPGMFAVYLNISAAAMHCAKSKSTDTPHDDNETAHHVSCCQLLQLANHHDLNEGLQHSFPDHSRPSMLSAPFLANRQSFSTLFSLILSFWGTCFLNVQFMKSSFFIATNAGEAGSLARMTALSIRRPS